ncbi:LuxR C-terminal-related transcriptional regulator [Variovorax sp. KK3]|uniref:helix-turn-helix transcriptional regulator n=1 Tax=Variovorax sp. KK3 TaxID=1855728 RepID=UPI00097C2A6C|nr:LuxR C-terminal-related transcriptional regulator [Variovorax sp. KK3]
MQSISIARAKIQAPRFRRGLIERSELEQQFGDAIRSRRLVLLIAPAGYGKTAALSRQLQRLPEGCAVVWLAADEEDDLHRFLSHLIEALEPLDPPWRMAPEAMFELVAHGRLRETATAMLHAIQATETPQGGVIVLDDMHAVADHRVFEFLECLLAGLPQNWALVIASREEPPAALGLWRWRARRELAEFDVSALSFSAHEAQDLWRHATGRDEPEEAQRLRDRTQGWAAGLCLGLEASSRSTGNAPMNVWRNRRDLFDYLTSEVFEDLPEELQQFLLRCSVLAELTVERCEQVSGNPRAAELLEMLERRRLFVSVLDGEELTLRLHDLFRDFLEERLRRQYPDEVPALLRRAAAGEADPVRRTMTYLRAGAWEEAQRSLADATPDMLASDEGARVIRLVEQFPPDIQERSPMLAYLRGLCAWPHDQYTAVAAAMDRAATGFAAEGRHDEAQRAQATQALAVLFCGQMDASRRLAEMVRARPMDLETETLSELLEFWYEAYHGPVEGPGERLSKVVTLLQRNGSPELWARCITNVNMFISRPGVGQQIRRLVDSAKLAVDEAHWSFQANVRLTEAYLLLWQGRIGELESLFQRIEEDARWLGQPANLRARLLVQKLNYHVLRDDRSAVRQARDLLVAHANSLDPSSDLPLTYLAVAMRASVAIEDWSHLRVHLPRFELDAGRENPSLQMFMRAFTAQLALHDGRVGEALADLRDLVAHSAQLNTTYLDAMVRTRLALAEMAGGSPGAAWQALEPLIDRVTIQGNLGELLGTGVQALTELSRAPWDRSAPADKLAALRRWIEAVAQSSAPLRRQERRMSTEADDAGLSPRELEVLALLAAGQSNKLIARHLDLSPHTVKRHVARILDRLDVSSRLEAAAWHSKHVAGHMPATGT